MANQVSPVVMKRSIEKVIKDYIKVDKKKDLALHYSTTYMPKIRTN